MQMVNGLAGIIIGVGDDAEAAFLDTFDLSHLAHRVHDGNHVFGLDAIGDVVIVILRDDEHMHGHHGIQIPEGKHSIILIDLRRWDVS